jgi:short-subunit dehydrogenase
MKFVAKTVFTDKSTKSVHFLMNNAAKAIGGNAIDTPMSEFIAMMETNLYGTIQTCQLFIPRMKELGEPGIIVNTGSKQGISMPPGNLTYNITKAALKTYTEGLEHELMMDRMNNCGTLKAALLIPGWVNTSIKVKEMRDRAALSKTRKFNYDQMKKITTCEENPADGAWMPKEVFDFMFKKLDNGSFYIICPDNEVDALTDRARMTWAMQDITEDRPPLSRWNPEWKGEFDNFVKTQK